jgi:hypothetical protein
VPFLHAHSPYRQFAAEASITHWTKAVEIEDIGPRLSEVEHRNSVAEIANSSPAFGVPHLGSRSFAQRLKRLESRFVPPDRLQREVLIQTVDPSGRVVGTYLLTPDGLKLRTDQL